MRKSIATATLVLMTSGLVLGACSGGAESGASGDAGGKLDIYLNMTTGSPAYTEMKAIVDKFEQETGTDVEFTIDSADVFQKEMTVRMASNNLPDVFSTHGWSVQRYSPFLEPLNDQPWMQYMDSGLDTAMKDADGNVYALPLEYTVTGISVNFDVLSEAGVDPDSLTSWEAFTDALGKIKEAGKTPITCAGKISAPGNLADFIASGAFSEDERESFRTGDFLSEEWQTRVLDLAKEWADGGYFNPDYSSATADDMASQIGQGQAAFAFAQPTLLATALSFNPDANVGFIPLPSGIADPYLVGGEGVNAYGVAKDSPNKEAALKFLDFVAQPENASAMAEAIGSYSGLTNATPDLGTLQSSYDKWVKPGDLVTEPFFDRVFLPNGIWATLITTTDAVITGQSDPATATSDLKDQYTTLGGKAE
ncbi:ABC transporter substrate-binding protein [Actinomyces sp.]|uniref:ABC transporter substrate-binding protein n=1 Tax=Actinomyces sp. TaxID=29317 RepID=UPI0028985EE2|nr:ABC transporter substrate-binding protein [Actinomyces sp.]